jgi:hypothetical protein
VTSPSPAPFDVRLDMAGWNEDELTELFRVAFHADIKSIEDVIATAAIKP